MNSYFDLVEREATPGSPPVVRGGAIRFYDGSWSFWELGTGRRAEYDHDPAVDLLVSWIGGLKLVARFQVEAAAPARSEQLPKPRLLGQGPTLDEVRLEQLMNREVWGI
jgi:hypothetical protein